MDNFNGYNNPQNSQQNTSQYPQQGQGFVPQKNTENNRYGQTAPQNSPYYQQPYMQQPPQNQYPPYQTPYQNGFMPPLSPEEEGYRKAATVSLILGIISVVLSLLCCTVLIPALALIPAIVSLVFAHKASKSRLGYSEGKIGKVLSIIAIVFVVIFTFLIIQSFASGEFNDLIREFKEMMDPKYYNTTFLR